MKTWCSVGLSGSQLALLPAWPLHFSLWMGCFLYAPPQCTHFLFHKKCAQMWEGHPSSYPIASKTPSMMSYPYKVIWQKPPNREKICFGSQFQKVSAHRGEESPLAGPAQSVAVGTVSGSCSYAANGEAETACLCDEKCKLQRSAPSDLFLPARPAS